MPDCQQLAAKLFFHAATIYWLRQGTKAPLPSLEEGAFFYDFPSVTVVTRAALETFLTLFEVFLEPTTEDEAEFNHALWQLSGFIVREDFVPSDPTLQDRVSNSQKEIQQMRTRLRRTKKFNSLTPGQQKDVLRGKRKTDWRKVARAAGFGEQTIRRWYAYYSGYVHADGLSGAQIVSAQTGQDQIEFIQTHMLTVMVMLSKLIIGYAGKFPEARAVCNNNPDTHHLAQVLSGAASLLP